MNIAEIAKILIESPSLVAAPVLRLKLGQTGYTEALRRGWIGGDMETGLIQVSSRNDRRAQMREAAKSLMPATVTEASVERTVPGRNFVMENFSSSPVTLVQRDVTEVPGKPDDAGADIGDEVTVAEGGQSYVARIQAKQPDGKFKLTFGGPKPGRDTFGVDELKVTKRGAPATGA